jgi:flagellar FliJ protein
MSRSLIFSKDQMTQLQDYANDTDSRWIGASERALSSELIRHHYQFMGRLQQAISMQTGAVRQLQEQEEQAKQVLLQTEQRLMGLERIFKNRKSAQQRNTNRMEQRQTDEFAAMLHARNRTQFLSGEST